MKLPNETYLEALEFIFPKEVIETDPEYDVPPGWTIVNKGSFTSGMFGAWPPGTKPGNQKFAHLANVGEKSCAEMAWDYVKGKIPLHYMQFTSYGADELLALRIRYRFDLVKDEYELNFCKRRWPLKK